MLLLSRTRPTTVWDRCPGRLFLVTACQPTTILFHAVLSGAGLFVLVTATLPHKLQHNPTGILSDDLARTWLLLCIPLLPHLPATLLPEPPPCPPERCLHCWRVEQLLCYTHLVLLIGMHILHEVCACRLVLLRLQDALASLLLICFSHGLRWVCFSFFY